MTQQEKDEMLARFEIYFYSHGKEYETIIDEEDFPLLGNLTSTFAESEINRVFDEARKDEKFRERCDDEDFERSMGFPPKTEEEIRRQYGEG